RQVGLVHFTHQSLGCRIVHGSERDVSQIWIRPLHYAIAPRCHGRGLNGLSFSVHRMVQEPLRLLAKRHAIGCLDESLFIVDPLISTISFARRLRSPAGMYPTLFLS